MEYELNDQDRADLVKNFFKKYGIWIVAGIVIIAIGFCINAYMQKRDAQANEAASSAYQAMLTIVQNGATPLQVTQSANQLIKDYPDTVYATMANLTLASLAVQQSNLANAEEILRNTLKENHSNNLAPIITLRLARVLLAENKADEAINILQNPPQGFEAPYALLTGDAKLQQSDQAGARASYLVAQKANQNNPLLSQLLAERLNSLGGSSS